MSRIAIKPIKIIDGAKINLEDSKVIVSGPKGELFYNLPDVLTTRSEGEEFYVERKNEEKFTKSLHGLYYRLIEVAIKGVTEGWKQTLELVGTGYRARMDGKNLVMSIGFSHPVVVSPPEGVSFVVEENKIYVTGIDRQLVGQVAANVRRARPPEPYKGKGIKYEGEFILRKAGKAAKVGGGT